MLRASSFVLQPLFLNGVSIGGSVRKEEDSIGFSLKYGDMTLGLDCLSVNDKTLWMSKLSDALSNFATTEKKFLTKQKSGKSHDNPNILYLNAMQQI